MQNSSLNIADILYIMIFFNNAQKGLIWKAINGWANVG